MFTTKDFDEMKAMLKAELKAELAAEFNQELQNLRQDVEKLRATLRAPPNDDVADVKDAVPDRMQDAAPEESTQDYDTPRGFDTCLKQQFVKIVKASWLLKWQEGGNRVERRQELPEEAFWTPSAALKEIDERAKHIETSKFLFVLSYRWLQSGHPDPYRHHLNIVCKFLALATKKFGDVGLFWDFLSLYQADDDNGRTEQEKDSFNKGLKAANLLYAHRLSVVVVQPLLPLSFTGPSYEWSGWCHFESAVSNLIKPWDQRLNVQLAAGYEKTYKAWRDNCKVSRNPPVSPATFQAQIDTRIFTNGHTDKKIVVQLYASTFVTLAASAEKLDYAHLLWSQGQATVLSLALPQFVKCSFLDVSRNPFGTQGVVQLTGGTAKMPELRVLIMRCCRGLAVAVNVPKWSANVAHIRTLELLDVGDNAFETSSIPTLAKHLRCPLKIDSSPRDLKDGGFTVKQLKDFGYKGKQLKHGGFTARELKNGGFNAQELKNGGFNARELKDAGFNAMQLRECCFTRGQLIECGFCSWEIPY